MLSRIGGVRALALVAVTASLAGCSAQYRDHGYVPLPEDLAQIEVGRDTRDTVRETLGAPTTAGMIDDRGFYYVSSRMRQFAWRAPEEVDRQVVAVSFNEGGTVTNVERFGLEDGQVVPLERRVTETGGNVSFIRQLLSRLGGFSPASFLNN
jgi:outer membrane protein assembly factor BamE (lipoprotein component of BamABCDE complex)